jgi:hypothetical protein
MKPLYAMLPISYLQLLVKTHALFTGKLANVRWSSCLVELKYLYLSSLCMEVELETGPPRRQQ